MKRGYKYRIYPNKAQQGKLKIYFAASRKVYNWGLNLKDTKYTEGEAYKSVCSFIMGRYLEKSEIKEFDKEFKLSAYDLSKLLTKLKKTEDWSWLNQAPSVSLIWALNNLDLAFKNFFRRVRSGETPGYPKFKSYHDKQSIQFHQGYRFTNKGIVAPKLGEIKMVKHRLHPEDTYTCTLSQNKSGKYYISIICEDHKDYGFVESEEKILGIDHGVINYATLSDGVQIKNPKFLDASKKLLVRRQRQLSKKLKGSENFRKSKTKLARCHEKISNQRIDFAYRSANQIINHAIENGYDCIALRKYDIKEMQQQRDVSYVALKKRFNEMLADRALFRFHLILKDLCVKNGLNFIDKIAANTTLNCYICNHKNEIDLKKRTHKCENCGASYDIDENAAKNTAIKALKVLKYS